MDFNWHGAEPNIGHNSAMLALQIYCAKYNGNPVLAPSLEPTRPST